MKTDLIPGIQNPLKNQDLIVQTIAHVTTDIKVMKQIKGIERTPIQITIKNSFHQYKTFSRRPYHST